MNFELILYIAVMAAVTYLIRMLPLVFFRKKIKNKFLKSFLFYVPYAVLGAMTVPAVFYSTGSIISALAGCAVAVVLSVKNRSLITVALCACSTVFVVELVIGLIEKIY